MTATSGVGSSSGTDSGLTQSAAASSASASYNTFLKMLTTQLQHQDPLNPTNTDTFTSEMIQLSGVEQELAINDTLSTISTNLNSITTTNGLGYIGKTVTATGSTAPMQDGSADWNYTLDSVSSDVKLTVKDSDGNTVYTTTGDGTSGMHSFSWDGTTSGGSKVTSGDYTLSISATDSSGQPVGSTINMIGQVTGVDTSSGSTTLKVGDLDVSIANVTSITN